MVTIPSTMALPMTAHSTGSAEQARGEPQESGLRARRACCSPNATPSMRLSARSGTTSTTRTRTTACPSTTCSRRVPQAPQYLSLPKVPIVNANALRRTCPTPSQKYPRLVRRAKNALRKESHRPARRERNLRPLTPPPPRGLPPMEAIGVTTIIGKRVCQKILADATIVAAQPPATNHTVLEATIKCDTTIMRTDTARAFGTMTGINTEVTRRVTAAGHLTTGREHARARGAASGVRSAPSSEQGARRSPGGMLAASAGTGARQPTGRRERPFEVVGRLRPSGGDAEREAIAAAVLAAPGHARGLP